MLLDWACCSIGTGVTGLFVSFFFFFFFFFLESWSMVGWTYVDVVDRVTVFDAG